MGKGIIECKGPYVEGEVLLPDGMVITAAQLHWKWNSNDYRLKVKHPDIQVYPEWANLPKVIIHYEQDKQGNTIVKDWEVCEYT